MPHHIPVLGHQDLDPEANPTGESLLDRSRAPWKIWVPPSPCLVLGHSQDPARELRLEAVAADRIPVLRRMGGGGAVLLSPACVCVALRFRRPQGRTLHDFFASGSGFIRDRVGEAFGIPLVERGISDLAHPGLGGLRKVLGCSLYMPRDFALYLASILVRPDFAALDRYLAHPSREPDYRGGRGHSAFLTGLEALSGHPLPAEEVAAYLAGGVDSLRDQLDWPDRDITP